VFISQKVCMQGAGFSAYSIGFEPAKALSHQISHRAFAVKVRALSLARLTTPPSLHILQRKQLQFVCYKPI